MIGRFLFASLSSLWLFFPAQGAVTPNSLFADDMVLQRDAPVPIWGTADPGEKVTVEFVDQTVSATADKDGKWLVKLQPLAAGGPFTLTITGSNTVTVTNVLVGEVWVCSGQSNMERQLGPRPPQPPIDNWEEEAATANFPQIREFKVPEKGLPSPIADAGGKWTVCSPETAPEFCAVGFFFARALYQKIRVPIGLVVSAFGGTSASAWTSHEALASKPETEEILTAYDKIVQAYPAQLAAYQQTLPELTQKYNDDVAAAQKQGLPPPKPPRPPQDPSLNPPARHYNAMIAPLIPFAIRGVIWYQGENDSGHGKQYQTLFPLLIADWRQRWGEGDFPFFFVQLAPCGSNDAAVREAQLLTFKSVPNTAMTVTTDIGDPTNVHPPHKAPVGDRLALAARALVYGEKIEYSGPIFDSAQVTGNQVVLSFTHADSGLVAKDGPLKGFEIAGPDKRFGPADAEIQGNTIIVTSPQVPNPVDVRYGWTASPDVNLYNGDGLPASPFQVHPD